MGIPALLRNDQPATTRAMRRRASEQLREGGFVLTVIGEALIDLVDTGDPEQFTAYAGGSPLNVAIGLARLGHQTTMLARLGEDRFGQLLRQHAGRNGVLLDAGPAAREPSTLAVVSLDDTDHAEYGFYVNGIADWQ